MTKYNPFKMWGSWVGAVVGIIPVLWMLTAYRFFGITSNQLLNIYSIFLYLNPIYYLEIKYCHEAGCGLLSFFTMPIIFFLIGWGIHSYIRYVRSVRS